MNKILNVRQATKLSSKLKKQNKIIVLIGGVFDILHIGHVRFIQEAKKQGDFLFVLLESDESVRKTKGPKRPLNGQKDRAEVLSALKDVDYVVKLKGILENRNYDNLVSLLKPNVLATTQDDSYIFHKVRQAKLINAKVKTVIKRVKNKSTSKILELLK